MASFSIGSLFSRSIARQFLVMYLFLGLVAIGGGFYIFVQIKELRTITSQVLFKSRQVQNYTLRLDGDINHLAYLFQQQHIVPSENIKARGEGIWNVYIKAHIDSITSIIQTMDNKALINKANELRKNVLQIYPYWKKASVYTFSAENPASHYKIDKNFDLLLNKIRDQISEFALDKQVSFQQGSQALNNIRILIFNFVSGLLAFILIWGLLHTFFIYRSVPRELNKITNHISQHTRGNLHPYSQAGFEEFRPLVDVTNELTNVLMRLKRLANEVGQGKFDVDIRPFGGKGEIGNEVTAMRMSLKQIVAEAKQRSWFNEGFAKFGEILRNYSDDENFYDTLISSMVKYLDLVQGGFFVVNDDGQSMELKASYAFGRKKFLEKTFSKDEGLIGQAWREKDIIHISDIPDSYAEITSGLGKSQPKSIMVAPLITNDKVMGVLEFASFDALASHQIEFVKLLGESIANTIEKIKIDIETDRLLTDSQELAERLKSQDEEMRQSMEELVVTQEKMEQNAYEMERQLQALAEAFVIMELNVNGHFTKVNPMLSQISGFSEKELLNHHYTLLMGQNVDNKRFEEDWNRILKGQFVKGEYVYYSKTGLRFWMYEVMYPIYGINREISKIFAIAYDITIQKEQEQKIKEQLQELQMSKRDVVNRIREVESKAKSKMVKMQMDFQQQLLEKERLIGELRQEAMKS
jgi:PAS domain S-box-containing protein